MGRDPADVTITNLSTALTAPDRRTLDTKINERSGDRRSPEEAARATNAGTTEDQIGRYREFAEAGVQTAIVSLADVGTPGSVLDFAEVISAFA